MEDQLAKWVAQLQSIALDVFEATQQKDWELVRSLGVSAERAAQNIQRLAYVKRNHES